MTTDNINQPGVGVAAESPQAAEPAEEVSAAEAQSEPATGQALALIPEPEVTGETGASAPEGSPNVESAAQSTAAAAEAPAAQDFGAMLDNYEKESAAAIQEGEVVRGTVIDISDQNVLVDIGYKCEGVVPKDEVTDRAGTVSVKPGDQIDVLIKSLENQDGYAVLSRVDAVRMQAWDTLKRAHQNHETVKGRVIDRIKGGLKVDIDGVPAFLPGSQVDVRPVRNLDAFRGQEIEARVIKLNRKRGNVVISRKAVIEESSSKKKDETLGNIEEGVIMEGVVKSLTDYGAFIDLGGIDGLLHITDMSWSRIQTPGEMFKVGDTVQVKVLKFDR
ncbi:MAG: 30S ribosomal protein S1, partial [Blastocatellia bacterium]